MGERCGKHDISRGIPIIVLLPLQLFVFPDRKRCEFVGLICLYICILFIHFSKDIMHSLRFQTFFGNFLTAYTQSYKFSTTSPFLQSSAVQLQLLSKTAHDLSVLHNTRHSQTHNKSSGVVGCVIKYQRSRAPSTQQLHAELTSRIRRELTANTLACHINNVYCHLLLKRVACHLLGTYLTGH